MTHRIQKVHDTMKLAAICAAIWLAFLLAGAVFG
jgi:hypothetical protein